jgi:hypothetical protein
MPSRRAAPRDRAEEQEHAAADHVEREDLAQRLWLDDQAVQADADERRRSRPNSVARSRGRHPGLAGCRLGCARARRSTDQGRASARASRHQRELDDHDQRLRPAVRIGEEGARGARPAKPIAMNARGPMTSRRAASGRLIGGASVRPAICTSSHIAARIVAPWNLPPGSIRTDPEDVEADDDADRRQHAREKARMPSGSAL